MELNKKTKNKKIGKKNKIAMKKAQPCWIGQEALELDPFILFG